MILQVLLIFVFHQLGSPVNWGWSQKTLDSVKIEVDL